MSADRSLGWNATNLRKHYPQLHPEEAAEMWQAFVEAMGGDINVAMGELLHLLMGYEVL